MKTMVSTAGSGASGVIVSSDVLPRGAKAGPWVIERELGRGGMGAVYAVVHDDIGKRAALKVVHQHLLVPGFNSDRMLLEAKVVNQVGHPNIVDIFETGTLADGRPYIVMERLDGHALSTRADECKLLPELVISILMQVCDALIAAHNAGIVHRDLKLDNVFLVDNPEDPATPKVKLLDWGIAKVMSHDAHHTLDGQLMGTPQYLAPEQARGHAVSPQTDVYSLGVMAYELFLEQLPFEAETAAEVIALHLRAAPPLPRELWPDIPPVLQDLLLAMLAKIPDQRPTMFEVVRRLDLVREELDRRRHVPSTSRYPTATPIEGARLSREVSVAEVAATAQTARRAATRRWQYAIGAFVLGASAMAFGFSRVGGRSASAATTVNASGVRKLGHVIAAPPAVVLPVSPSIVSDLEQRPPDAGAPARAAIIPAATQSPVRAVPSAGRAPANTHGARALLPSTATRPTPAHKPPVTLHRGIKADPDGTLDPYR
jgi:tRNA A-37 threonylcarbamoyl transferase component Bud32